MDKLESLLILKKILATQLSVNVESIGQESDLKKDLGADSLDIAEISMMIEDQYSCRLSDADYASIKTVGDLFDGIWAIKCEKKEGL